MKTKPLRHHHAYRQFKKRQKDKIYCWINNPNSEVWCDKDLKNVLLLQNFVLVGYAVTVRCVPRII